LHVIIFEKLNYGDFVRIRNIQINIIENVDYFVFLNL
jgi:hypothetical protein